jgi:hypothetical protein
MSMRARKRAWFFSVERMTRGYVDLYRRVLSPAVEPPATLNLEL